ncbi:MAG: chromosomal replication initiator protein DnaA [Bryobacterales bacterium]|nr:chromosomal replication initiator protein DnaA [Bryobacterales bacterium]
MNPWDQIKEKLESSLSAESFQNWVKRTQFSHLEHSTLYVSVPDQQTREWMESEYGERVRSCIQALGIRAGSVVYEIQSGNSSVRLATNLDEQLDNYDLDGTLSNLNPKFTFDSYVVGASNQFAHAAARSVASNPSRSYNPLFIYGGVGMGKTHLMHAIGRALVYQSKLRVVYTSSERFTNEVVTGIRLDKMAQFRQRYRSADVLLIDDIQMLGNRERTQEEFFHTFNELHDHQKQIVISSDAPPKEIPGLVDRLRSRFEWGLMADILPPDLETKMAILDKKAEAQGVTLPEDVRTFIASRTKSNVRELEGSLVKLIAVSSLTGAAINLAMAQQNLKHLLQVQDRRITIDTIQKAVADRFGVKQSSLREKSNTKAVVYPRQVAMYLVKELTSASLPEIGRAFGGKHHTTVMHSIEKIAKLRQIDADLNRQLHSLIDSLQ